MPVSPPIAHTSLEAQLSTVSNYLCNVVFMSVSSLENNIHEGGAVSLLL